MFRILECFDEVSAILRFVLRDSVVYEVKGNTEDEALFHLVKLFHPEHEKPDFLFSGFSRVGVDITPVTRPEDNCIVLMVRIPVESIAEVKMLVADVVDSAIREAKRVAGLVAGMPGNPYEMFRRENEPARFEEEGRE